MKHELKIVVDVENIDNIKDSVAVALLNAMQKDDDIVSLSARPIVKGFANKRLAIRDNEQNRAAAKELGCKFSERDGNLVVDVDSYHGAFELGYEARKYENQINKHASFV